MAGHRLPGPWLQDANGRPSDDPNTLDAGGSILPIGGLDYGHKGFALSLLIESLTQGLSGHGRLDAPKDWGASVLVLALAPAVFRTTERFCQQVEWISDACKAATPGEQALARKRASERAGLALAPGITTELKNLAARFAIAPPPLARLTAVPRRS